MIKQGSRWASSDHKMFIVLHTIEQDGHTWVHYRDVAGDPPKEYSCYQESFVQRFNEILNDNRS